ncbi:hypothetical protein EG833_01765 [archaeon]|nr:hypothetical protein [archaeon]
MRSIGDVVTIFFDNKPTAYARIESITPDVKKHWLEVHLLFLSFPPQEATWILREEYLEGEGFTMKEIPVRIIPLERPGAKTQELAKDVKSRTSPGEVVSFEKYRRKKHVDDPE